MVYPWDVDWWRSLGGYGGAGSGGKKTHNVGADILTYQADQDIKPLQEGVKQGMEMWRDYMDQARGDFMPYMQQGQQFMGDIPGIAGDLAGMQIPGPAQAFQMPPGPSLSQYDPGLAPDYNPWQSSYNPQQWQPGQAPDRGMSGVMGAPDVGRGPTGGVSDVMGAPEQQAYQRGQFDITKDPGYQFRLGEGEKAIKRAAAAKGGYGDPAMMKELLGFSQGLASEEADRAYGRFSTDEAAQQAGYESTAQRGLQGYGIEAPLRTGVQESLADRDLSEWATHGGLDLQGYGIEAPMQYARQEDYANRLSGDWRTAQGLGFRGAQTYGDQMMQQQGMQQAENQFVGGLGLDAYLGAGQLGRGAHQDYMGNQLQLSGQQLPYQYMGWEHMQKDPWKQYQAQYAQGRNYLGDMTDIVDRGMAAAARSGQYGSTGTQGLAQGAMDLGQAGMMRSMMPWNLTMDALGAGSGFAGAFI